MPNIEKCVTPFCRNKRTANGRRCNTCNSRIKRAKNPVRYAYDVLKMNAKRREKPFTITFQYFKQFCIRTDYVAGKGRTKESYSVDRIKNELGYIPGNLRILTLSDNSKKGTRKNILTYDYRTKSASVYTTPIHYKTA